MYGYEITQSKGNNSSELNITEGALYPALHWKQKEF
jgi:DNA-binding PadR family transcriptional regulator